MRSARESEDSDKIKSLESLHMPLFVQCVHYGQSVTVVQFYVIFFPAGKMRTKIG